MKIKLLSCDCGESEDIEAWIGTDRTVHIMCNNCAREVLGDTIDEAIETWNGETRNEIEIKMEE